MSYFSSPSGFPCSPRSSWRSRSRRVEVTPFTLLRRVAETTERAEVETKVVQPARPLPPPSALTLVADDGFTAAAAPEGSSARALVFVKHVRRQAI